MKPNRMMTESVEALVARGEYLRAAAQAAEKGDLLRAIELCERVWKFAEAIPFALAVGDRPLAVRLALDARDLPRADALAAEIADDQGLARAAEAFGARGEHHRAAELHQRAGRLVEAAASYQKAGALLDAGRMFERAGRYDEARRQYEWIVARAADATEMAQAQLALGRILGDFGRPREATRALQVAARHPATRTAAQRRLCAELLALGLPHAAEEVARRLHQRDPHAIAAAERRIDAPELPRRFRVLGMLGAGALGRVYAAHDELLGKTVALKALSIAGSSDVERTAFGHFLREARAAARLQHPNIVALHEIDETAALLVLEHLPGGTLASRLAQTGPLSPPSVRRLALELLAGLAAAHRAGIVHRDVKPANIFFDAAGSAKLGDFGAAHLLAFGATQTGSFIGTLAYLSPEQINGSRVGAPTDLYALGATLYESLTGRPPFAGPDIVGQHLAQQPEPPSALHPGVGHAHDLALLRALAKASDDRFSSADAMAEAIRAWPAVDDRPSPPAIPPAPATSPTVQPERRLVRTTPHGRLFATFDPRTGRDVLIEELDAPLDDAALADLRRLAAAAGPNVARVLSYDGRRIVYEALD